MAAAVTAVDGQLAKDFDLPPGLKLSADLRAPFEAMRDAHLQRARGLLKAWAEADAATLTPAQRVRDLGDRLAVRYFNETALWHLDSAGGAHDQRMLKAMARPGWCAIEATPSLLARLALLVQRADPADQPLLVADHRVLLARWGDAAPRTPPPRPAVPVQARAEALIKRFKAAHPEGEPPLTPAIAWALAQSPDGRMEADMLCPLQHWWLRRELATPGADARAAYVAVRYGNAPQLRPGEEEATAYPAVARHYGVEGIVAVKGRIGPKGLQQAQVVRRDIRVPGLGSQPPVAFESVLDAASLARAAAMRPDKSVDGEETTVEFVWKMAP